MAFASGLLEFASCHYLNDVPIVSGRSQNTKRTVRAGEKETSCYRSRSSFPLSGASEPNEHDLSTAQHGAGVDRDEARAIGMCTLDNKGGDVWFGAATQLRVSQHLCWGAMNKKGYSNE
jgi:hypothetical protein